MKVAHIASSAQPEAFKELLGTSRKAECDTYLREEGCMLYKKPAGKFGRTSINVPDDFILEIDQFCNKHKIRSRGVLYRAALRKFMEEMG